ncbi:MAG: hypothetical protein JO297_05030, partial [Nitrososphaeraceae archaeon]|nr:hypothetical protein [Nitrososphaeraceae archaeon]
MTIDQGPAKLDNSIGDIESVRQSLNTFYTNTINKAQNAQNKYPLKNHENERSRDNLLCYLAFRENDLSHLQIELAEQGLSSLGRHESEVIVSIEKVMKNLGLPPYENHNLCKPTYADARTWLAKRSQQLLGGPREVRKTRIMVTLDSFNIHQPELLEQLLRLSSIIKRNHVSIWNWIQKYKPQKFIQKKKKVMEFIIDETLLKVSNEYVWLW